jgi:hypothetical protein
MTRGRKDEKAAPCHGRKGDAARAERLRAALRENLKRRKAQTRGRTEPGAAPHDSAGIVPDKSGD